MISLKQYVLFNLLFTFSFSLFSQTRIISGYVYDVQSQEKLIGAHVFVKAKEQGTTTNGYGYFSLSIPSDTHEDQIIMATYVGYNPTEILLKMTDSILHIKLKTSNELSQVTVTANRVLPIEKRNQISTIRISKKDLNLLPSMGGEKDILKAYQLMPGVQSGNEGFSALYVRGGSPDQNLILLDDVPLYYVNHLGGFAGIFNSDAINSTQLIKGGFPAEYGTRLSSVLDVKMKEGNKRERASEFTIGMLSSKILIEGPIKQDTSSFLFSARRFMYDVFMRLLSNIASSGNGSMGYTFYDVNAKWHRVLDPKNNIYFSFYMGDDAFSVKMKDKANGNSNLLKTRQVWGNYLGAFRWNRVYNPSLFGNLVVSFTQYRYKSIFDYAQKNSDVDMTTSRLFYSGVRDFSIHKSLEYKINNNYQIKYGVIGTYHFYTPGLLRLSQENSGNQVIDENSDAPKINALESGIYVENRINLFHGISANAGLRLASYSLTSGKTFLSFEPRLLLGYLINDRVNVSAAYSKMQQHVHMISSTGTMMPVDFWMPSTDKIVPAQSTQYAFAVTTTLSEEFEFSSEAFYKTMSNLIAFKEGSSFTGLGYDWEDKVEIHGFGEVYGVEFLLQKRLGKSTGWVGYTYSRNTRTFDGINNGKAFPFSYDRTHDVSIVYNLQINRHIDFSATWVYGTGMALTFPTGKYNVVDLGPVDFGNNYEEEVYLYNEKNSVRAESYHRLDISLNLRKEKKHGTRTWNISIYNIYNRKNPYSYFPNEITRQNHNEVLISKRTMFPFIPSLSYSFVFK
ncbi:MAG: TonB-dependent receptor [Salinivirgaceae bacterium]|nr:TonB-dependent receptor [Salinivirgaceae bacterium]